MNFDEFLPGYDAPHATLPPLKNASCEEALLLSLNTLGRVDLPQMSTASGIPVEELILHLRGSAIFQDPKFFMYEDTWHKTKGWLFAPQYLCGNIRKKLQIAKRMNQKFPGCFDENIRVLEGLLPANLKFEDIHVGVGAPWVPADFYAKFLKYLLQEKVEVVYVKETATFRVTPSPALRDSVLNNSTYGTADLSAVKIFEHMINGRTVKCHNYLLSRGWNYERVLNASATLAAQEKEKLITEAFNRWLKGDTLRRAMLEEFYNNAFGGYIPCAYDGSFLTLPQLNPAVTLYPQQKNGIARFLFSKGNLLFAHDVGTGKTYLLIVGVHEMHRMHLSRKNLVAVPGAVLQDFEAAHKYLYPQDKILVVHPKDFTGQAKNEILELIRDRGHEFVAIYMAHSTLDQIKMGKNHWIRKMAAQLNDLRIGVTNACYESQRRELNRQIKRLEKQLSKFMVETPDSPLLPFEKLDIETLVVDEAHHYKNIPMQTRTENIVGLHSKGSEKAKEMLERTRCVNKTVFATATPITNSMADLFVMQTYLQPEELALHGLDSFDMWCNTFASKESFFELQADAVNLRAVTRFASFQNLNELVGLFGSVCDFYHSPENGEGLPAFRGYTDVVLNKSPQQEAFIEELARRNEAIKAKEVARTEDNMLKITIDGRKCAVDIRLVDKNAILADHCENKVEACAKRVYRVYQQFPGTCQVIFSDIGTPKSDFNIYDSLKAELMGHGIPECEIAFIHSARTEAARTRLFAKVNKGLIRVIIGSTEKLGTGVNIQNRLIALHHLDVPWRPSDMVQREGRILRPGNQNKEVFIYRYITKGTFDAYSWQLLDSKAHFIYDFMRGYSNRSAKDIADLLLNYAEVKALTVENPLIKTRIEVNNQRERVQIACRARQQELANLQSLINSTPLRIEELTHQLALVNKDIQRYEQHKVTVPQEERKALGEELLLALAANHMKTAQRVFCQYQGFDVVLPCNMDKEHPTVLLTSPNKTYTVVMDTQKPLGCCMRLDAQLNRLPQMAKEIQDNIEKAKQQKVHAREDFGRGNPHLEELARLESQLEAIDRELLQEREKKAS